MYIDSSTTHIHVIIYVNATGAQKTNIEIENSWIKINKWIFDKDRLSISTYIPGLKHKKHWKVKDTAYIDDI